MTWENISSSIYVLCCFLLLWMRKLLSVNSTSICWWHHVWFRHVIDVFLELIKVSLYARSCYITVSLHFIIVWCIGIGPWCPLLDRQTLDPRWVWYSSLQDCWAWYLCKHMFHCDIGIKYLVQMSIIFVTQVTCVKNIQHKLYCMFRDDFHL